MQQGDDFTTPAASEQPAVPVSPTMPANQFVSADQPASAVPPMQAMPVANQTAPVMPPVSQPATGGADAEMSPREPRNHNSSRRVSLKIVLLLSIIVLVVAVCGFIYVLADKFGVFRGVSQKSSYQMKRNYVPAAVRNCRSGDQQNMCRVDLDPNMIPVHYTGKPGHAEWISMAKPEDASHQGEWYDYGQKQWANAVTVKDPSKYKGKRAVVDQADILGFWVYIPRYSYKVLRFSPQDPVVKHLQFEIRFDNVDVRREEPNKTGDWATHPAFTFGKRELNGIWVGKFLVTGDANQPTVLPNSLGIGNNVAMNKTVGRAYVTAQTFGVKDEGNVGGSHDFKVPPQNSHHLASYSSRLPRGSEMAAVFYLSTSKYGLGRWNGIERNMAEQTNTGSFDRPVTGCGPYIAKPANPDDDYKYHETYGDGGPLGTERACLERDFDHGYNGKLGQTASSTGNVTGIYDLSTTYYNVIAMTGVMAEPRDRVIKKNFEELPVAPYFEQLKVFNYSSCTWRDCGGLALYEILSKDTADDARDVFLHPDTQGRQSGTHWLGYNASASDRDSSVAFGLVGESELRVVLSPRPE